MSVRVMITGAMGQLGRALVATAPAHSTVIALSRAACDITDEAAVLAAIDRERPDTLINAAAYTAVDLAESEPEAAFAANAEAAAVMAQACAARGLRLLHVSTDFVFSGEAHRPYTPDAQPAPLGVYGASKFAGERAVQAADAHSLIMRTGWVYSPHGGNFFTTMLRLHRERSEIAVVADQIGTPTCAGSLARALWACVARPALRGVYHFSDAGVCSWYDFAQAIGEEAQQTGLLRQPARVRPIRTEDYPTPAKRPAFSVLDKTQSWRDLEFEPQHWRQALREMLRSVQETAGV